MNEKHLLEVIYIRTSRDILWDALTNPDVTQRYWFDTRIESDWRVGSTIRYLRSGELTDQHEILSIDPKHHLSHTFQPLFGEFQAELPSRVTFTLDQDGEVARLTIRHDRFPAQSKVMAACREGWPQILSNLKTLLETGAALPAFAF